MKLKQVEIKNYRSIKNAQIDFDPTCRILVGINESGKSNILDALSLLSDDFTPDRANDIREALPSEREVSKAFVRFIFTFEKEDSDNLRAALASFVLSKNGASTPLLFQDGKKLSLGDICDRYASASYEVDIIAGTNEISSPGLPSDATLAPDWLRPKMPCPDGVMVSARGKSIPLKDLSLVHSSLISTNQEDYVEPAEIEDLEQLFVTHTTNFTESSWPNVIYWDYDEANVLPSVVNIDSFIANPDVCSPLKHMFWLAGVIDIPGTLKVEREKSPNQFDNFLRRIARKTTLHFRSVWGDYKSVSFNLVAKADNIVPGVQEKLVHNFERRSDGFKRFVTFLLMISVNVKTDRLRNMLLLVDEPEVGLHPTGAQYLRDELIRIGRTNNVIYSTHSIFMVDPGDIERHYIVEKDNEKTTATVAGESNFNDEDVLYNALGHSVFAVLKESNLIFEGWRDKKLFQVALDAAGKGIKKKFTDVGICHAKGVGTIKSLTPALELAKRKCQIVSDADQPAVNSKKQFNKDKGYGVWTTYRDIDSSVTAVTGEDFLKDSFITAKVNNVTPEGFRKFDQSVIAGNPNKIEKIRKWLGENGITKEHEDQLIKLLKRLLFESLTAAEISDEYTKILKMEIVAK